MRLFQLRKLPTLLLGLGLSVGLFAQQSNTVQIDITKMLDGQQTQITEQYVIPQDQDIQAFVEAKLEELGVNEGEGEVMVQVQVNAEQAGESTEGQEEIRIIRIETDGDEQTQNAQPWMHFQHNVMTDEEAKKPFLGVMLGINKNVENINGVETTDTKVLIEDVVEGGGAQAAGLQAGDEIVSINGTPVTEVEQITGVTSNAQVGETILLEVLRNGALMNFDVTLKAKSDIAGFENEMHHKMMQKEFFKNGTCCPKEVMAQCCPEALKACSGDEEPVNKAILGVTIEDTEDASGVSVLNVHEISNADEAGIKDGSIIKEIDKQAVNGVDDLIGVLAAYNPGDKVKVKFEQDGKTKKKKVKLIGKEDMKKAMAENNEEEFKHFSTPNNHYPNISQAEDESIKMIQLKVGDLEKLMEGQELEILITDQDTKQASDQLIIQLEDGATIDCPKFNIVITELNEEEKVELNENDPAYKIEDMSELDVINLALYPNPNSGIFELNFTLAQRDEVTVRIVSIDGKEAYSEKIENFEGVYNNRIDLTASPTGVYVLQVIQGDRMMTRKIVVE